MFVEDQLSFPGFEGATPGCNNSSGRASFQPVDIHGAYYGGHLYYTAQTVVEGKEIVSRGEGVEETHKTFRTETVVLRSDRTVHTAHLARAPKGTPRANRVWRLDDLVITEPPRVNPWATWRWPSIEGYLAGRSRPRPLKSLLEDILAALKSAIYLPRDEDYTILAFCVVLTYVQQIFDSVPLIFVCGPAGSGKTAIGQQMAQLCCNACIIGKVSPATAARQVDEARGLTVLDDLEAIGKRNGKDSAQFGDFSQFLKVSYNKHTSIKLLTDMANGTTRKVNSYGVKVITNTSGADEILLTRMLRVETATMPREFRQGSPKETFSPKRLLALRDELHCWAFSSVQAVAETYGRLFPQHDSRAEEIVAPLRVLAELSDSSDLRERLEKALVRQREKPPQITTVDELLRHTVENLVVIGQTEVSPIHVLMQMRSHAANREARHVNVKGLTTAWIGRKMRIAGMVDMNAREARRRLHGLKIRILPLSTTFVAEVDAKRKRDIPWYKDPVAYCTTWECKYCRYAAYGCPIKPNKLRGVSRGGSSSTRHRHNPRPLPPPRPPREDVPPRPVNQEF
ncbi:MAG: twinkle protein [Verrucomicrobiota bacterium]|jgi:hypothetical protein